MSTFKVTVERLIIEPHPNADKIEIVRVGDYQSIVRKDQFKTGDLAAYIPEQSLVPNYILKEMGLEGKLAGKEKNRVKAVRLRGVFSQGLVYPARFWWHEGQDVTDELGITKWEPPVPPALAGEVYSVGSGLTLKYDIENIKKFPHVIERGEPVIMSEKIHGCASYETMIETIEYGKISIGKIVENKIKCHVKSYNIFSNEVEYVQLEGWLQQENNNDWYEIELENGQKVKLTGNHLVWLQDEKCYRAVKDLSADDNIMFDD